MSSNHQYGSSSNEKQEGKGVAGKGKSRVHGSESCESTIDQRFRLLLLDRHLRNAQWMPLRGAGSKWVCICPFCGGVGRTEAQRNRRKAALLWSPEQNSWVFCCARKGSSTCSGRGMTLEKLLEALDTRLAEQYRLERWQAGTTGWGHNCPHPKTLKGSGRGGGLRSDQHQVGSGAGVAPDGEVSVKVWRSAHQEIAGAQCCACIELGNLNPTSSIVVEEAAA